MEEGYFCLSECSTSRLISELNHRSKYNDELGILLIPTNLLEEEAVSLFKDKLEKGNVIELINLLKNESKGT